MSHLAYFLQSNGKLVKDLTVEILCKSNKPYLNQPVKTILPSLLVVGKENIRI